MLEARDEFIAQEKEKKKIKTNMTIKKQSNT